LRGYELCLIFHPEVNDEKIDTTLTSVREAIENLKGSILKIEKWGKKNLKYPIKKNPKGYYCFVSFVGLKSILTEIDRLFRYNESVLRYNNVCLEKKIFEELKQAHQQKPESAPQPESDVKEQETKKTEEQQETVENAGTEE